MNKAGARVLIYFLALSTLFLASCGGKIPSLPFSTDEARIKKITEEQGKSTVFIGVYDRKDKLISVGSGFFVSQDGVIATNYHIVEKGARAIIKTIGGKSYEDIYLLSYDADKDVALLQVNETNAPYARLGDSSIAKQGDKVIVIGNNSGFQNTVFDGTIGDIKKVKEFIIFQTSCTFSESNSGAPLYNLKSEVVGITVPMPELDPNFSFAIPINYLPQFVETQKKISLKERFKKEQKKAVADYIAKQKGSSEFEPQDSLFDEAYEFCEKARQAYKKESSVELSGIKQSKYIEYLEQAIKINPYYHAAYVWLGILYSEAKDYKKAEECYLESIELKPKYQKTYEMLGKLYETQKQFNKALKIYNTAIIAGLKSSDIYASLGEIYLKEGNIEKAGLFYKEILNLDEVTSDDYEEIANFYLKVGRLKKSWEYLKKVTLWPYLSDELDERIAFYKKYLATNNFYAFESVGRICYLRLDYEKAVEYLEKAYKLNRNKFDQFYELGMSCKMKSPVDYKKAKFYLEKAVKKNPDDYNVNIELGIICSLSPALAEYYKVKPSYKESIKLFKKAKMINPKNSDPYYYLGGVYLQMQRYNEALNETKRVLNIKEDSFTFDQLAEIYLAMGEYEDALVAYKKSLALSDYSWTCWKIAETFFELEEYDEAIEFLKEKIEKYKTDHRLLKYLADAYNHKKEYQTAINVYKQYLTYAPKSSSPYFAIADCYFSLENWDESESWWKKTITIDPKEPGAVFNLGLVYLNKSQYREAKRNFKKALKIDSTYNEARTRQYIRFCQAEIDREGFPEQLRKLSFRKDNIGIIAKLLLCTLEYVKANNLLIDGRNETKHEDGRNIVSPKVYESEEYFKRIYVDLEKINSTQERIRETLNLFSYAVNQRIEGSKLLSEAYHKKRIDYKDEYEKSLAKIKMADKYLADALKIIRDALPKYKQHFGSYADVYLKKSISYYEDDKFQ